MNIAVITNDLLKDELLAQQVSTDAQITFSTDIIEQAGADCYIDLLFDQQPENLNARITKLAGLPADLILVNAVGMNSSSLPPHFIRFNGWPTLLKKNLVEASSQHEVLKTKATEVFSLFGKKTEWMEETATKGFLTPRVISMIINEAYHALEEKVSTKEEIDTAMKLGTNYPFGPFEWSRLIGLKRVYQLLKETAGNEISFSPLLEKEALQS